MSKYYNPSNTQFKKDINAFNFGNEMYSDNMTDMTQDYMPYSGNKYDVGMKNVFINCDFSQEPVGKLFFSETNIKRLQKQIREKIYIDTNHKVILDEDQDSDDLLVSMRAVYQQYGKYIKEHVTTQVKDLNKKLVGYVVPDMITQIKQYYGYLKDVNEPIKPIARPMNVSNAGRRTLPSITSIWNA
jgi:hypothetical protein